MNQSTKRILSTIAIVIASVAFGILISADLGLMKQSKAQSSSMQTPSGTVAAVTIPSFADVAGRVMPSVVSIRSTEIVHMSDQQRRFGIDPFEFFFPDPNDPRRPRRSPAQPDDDDEQQQVSGGSGFIISGDGYILTNNHVIEGASKIQVHYGADENGNGGRTAQAKVIGRDPATDIALVKIDVDQQLPFIRLGDSDRIRKGDWAIAVGHPFQFENTLTVGVISAKGRSLGGLSAETRSFENFIQTDAAINFGNSGGPLMNIAGEVVGINTAIRGGAQGIGFATPINTAKTILTQLKAGKVTRGYLGMQIQDVDEDIREAFRLSEARGALVQSVEEGKPADKAGIKHGDVVTEVDGKPIRNNRELIDYISYLPVGSDVKIALIRNGQKMTVTARTQERPSETASNESESNSPEEPVRNKLGMSVNNITPELRKLYSIPNELNGVVVVGVKNVSAAGDANLTEGDVISEVQGQRVNNVEEFRNAVDKVKTGQRLRLYVTSQTRNGTISTYRILQTP